jgi:heptaprenyl diphosphate synthase
LAYSLSGAVFSFIIMLITKRISLFSELGVSVSGGIFHNVAQILMAMLIMENEKIAMYLPALLISGTIAGAVVGIVAALLIKKLGKII